MKLLGKKDMSRPPQSIPHQGAPILDVIAPSSVEVDFKSIRVGNRFYRTFFLSGYPRFVSTGWLQPVIDFDRPLRIAMYVYPTFAEDVLENLKRKIAEMEATVSSDQEAGKMLNPKLTAELGDALSLQAELARSVERLFQFGPYITLSGETKEELEDSSRKLMATFSSILIVSKTSTLQMEEGFLTTMPHGIDQLYITRNMDTSSLASTFPFTSATLTQDKGVLYGVNKQNGSLVIFDRFSLENANEVVLGKSGSGKSFFIKLEAMRQFMLGTEIIIIDPENEYKLLAQTLGGEYSNFSATSPLKINPFDLSGLYEEGENELSLKILSLHSLLKVMLGEFSPTQDALLDRAIVDAYKQKGITSDPKTQTKEPPVMSDLYNVLHATQDPKAQELALRMERYVIGSLAGLFTQQSNFTIKAPFMVFSIQELEEELRPIAMHLILDFIWTRVRKTLKKRLLIVDEAWYLMKHEDSASFLYGIAKRARKYYLGLTTATQDVEDFFSTDYGKAVISNSSLQILLKQSTSEIDMLTKTFHLSQGERQLLIASGIGECIFFAGTNHVAMQIIAAPFEHDIITSNPADILKQREATQPLPTAPSPLPNTSG